MLIRSRDIDIIAIRAVVEMKEGTKEETKEGGRKTVKLPFFSKSRIGHAVFFRIFQNFIVLPSVQASNNAARSTIREGFSTLRTHIRCSLPLEDWPPPRLVVHVRPFFNIFRVATEMEERNWKNPCINCWTRRRPRFCYFVRVTLESIAV